MYAFDRDCVLVGALGNFAAGHPKNYKGAEMPLIKEVLAKVPTNSIIISNQAGISRGYTTLEVVQSQFDWLMAQQPNFIGAFFCPDEGATCYHRCVDPFWYHTSIQETEEVTGVKSFRKPDIGMGVLAQDWFGARITHYIGDLSGNPTYADGRDSDRQFAQNLGCAYLDVNNFLGLAPCRPVGRPKSSDRIRKQFLLTQKHIDILKAIAIKQNLVISQGSYKGQPNINAAIIWLVEN